MKTERILIFTDTNKAGELDRNIEATQQGANDLIHIFESFQSYKKIQTLDDFESLVSDPLSMFDETLQTNVDFKETGGKKGNPAVIASLFDIDRDNFINIVKGQTVIAGSCKPCAKLKIKQTGKGVINYSSFRQYQEYLIFDQGHFSIDETAVEEKKLTYQMFAETPKQIECYNFWINATETINELSKRVSLGGEPNAFSKLLDGRITYSYQDGKFSVDTQSLLFEIQSLNK